MKNIIKWNVVYGIEAKVVEADSEDEAEKMAYEELRDDAENNADYLAV